MSDPLPFPLSLAFPWWTPALVLVPTLATLLRTPVARGWIGDMLLHLRLRRALDRKRYHLFHNLVLATPDGVSRVDHVLVSRHGIFLIETRRYGGWIFGAPKDRMWTQKFPRRSFAFPNPLRQNDRHVRALAALAGADERIVFSLVVFVGNCTFKTAMPDQVTRARGCIAAIRARTEVLLGDADVEAILARLYAVELDETEVTETMA